MSWPDDNEPRYIVDAQPTVRVLDRAYCHAIVQAFVRGSTGRRAWLNQADALAASLNAADRQTDKAA